MADPLTLAELSKRSKVSLQTLMRYKKLYQDRIPSVGSGRKQRYPVAAVEAVQAIKRENIRNRGPRKTGGARRASRRKAEPKPAAAPAANSSAAGTTDGFLTLAQVARRTGINYRTLLRYLKVHSTRIPQVGQGHFRRYPPAAVAVFEELAAGKGPESVAGAGKRQGRRRAAGAPPPSQQDGLARRLQALEHAQLALTAQVLDVTRQLGRPLKVILSRSTG
jgi:MerR HTH family regulatory protein